MPVCEIVVHLIFQLLSRIIIYNLEIHLSVIAVSVHV
jgi:hypothetical protein